MRLCRLASLVCALLALCGLGSRPSYGHGGVPAPQQILWRGESMLVPTPYWGLFVGKPGGEWHWICDEAINAYQQHTFAVGTDGTIYATDRSGMQVSRDGGCSWESITGPLSQLYIVSIQSMPQDARVWALASGNSNGASLWTSDDRGLTWQQQQDVPEVWPAGLRISADGQSIVAGMMTAAAPRQALLLVSRDGGRTFASQSVFHLVGGQPLTQITPLWVDSQAPFDIWLAGRVDTVTTLLQVQSAAPPREHLRLTVNIFDLLRDPVSGSLVAATAGGLYTQTAGKPFAALSTLSTSRCLSAQGGELYACGWNFQPDLAAIVQLRDSAAQRTRLFQYQDTLGPQSCSADTAVGRICPMAWNIYADQLGIPQPKPPTSASGACAIAAYPDAQVSRWSLLLLCGSLCALACRRTTRRRTRAF